jgi:hypothetical protein
MVSPDSQADRAHCQAETPLSALFKFAEPALNTLGQIEMVSGFLDNWWGNN